MYTTPRIQTLVPMLHRLACCGAIFCFAAMSVAPARAAFHLWTFQELYTNSSGSLQFIELNTTSTGQNFLAGQTIQIKNLAGTVTINIPIPNTLTLAGDTTNHTFLLGTAGLHAAGGPVPDVIIPDDSLFQGGGTITLIGAAAGPGSYSALPTDGKLSRTFGTSQNAVNSPKDFAGAVGVVPEPTSMLLFASGAVLLLIGIRRRRAVRS